MDITAWAQEYFQKPQSVNTVHCDGLTYIGKVCCGVMNPHFKLFLKIIAVKSSV